MIKYFCDKCKKELSSKITITMFGANLFSDRFNKNYLMCEDCSTKIIKLIEGKKE